MEASSPSGSATMASDSSLLEKIAELQTELKRERFEHCMIETMYWDLHEDNGNYLNLNLQLEEAVEKLLLALSLPTDALYRPELTDYCALIRLVDAETPRLKSLMSGLDLLASLAVGLNATVEMHKNEIRALREEVCRLRSEGAGDTMGSTIDLDDSVVASRSHSPVFVTGENLGNVPLAQVSSEVMTECQTREVQQDVDMNSKSKHTESKNPDPITECEIREVQQNAGVNSKSRHAQSKGFGTLNGFQTREVQPYADTNSKPRHTESKGPEPIQECENREVQQNGGVNSESRHAESKNSQPLNGFQTQEVQPYEDINSKSRHVESKGSNPTNELGSLQDSSGSPNPPPFIIRVHHVLETIALQRSEINCAISVNGHDLAGNPFESHPGWQIHYSSVNHLDQRIITLNFRFLMRKTGISGGYERGKGFRLTWNVSRNTSFVVKSVKPFEPASLRNLPLSLTELCADKHVRGKLWQVALIGVFESPPDRSHRILKSLDEHMKVNLKALFESGSTNQIDIWFVNPKETDRRKQRQDMDALIALQSTAQ